MPKFRNDENRDDFGSRYVERHIIQENILAIEWYTSILVSSRAFRPRSRVPYLAPASFGGRLLCTPGTRVRDKLACPMSYIYIGKT